jgi:plastocyanin
MTVRRVPRPVASALGAGALLAGLAVSSAAAADAPVAISGFAFNPASVTVSVGDSVTWTNNDGVGHTATADDASFTTGTIAAGGSGSATFATAGTFAYHCTIHPAMTGTVIVQAAAGGGGTTATTPPTDAASPTRTTHGPASPLVLLALGGSWALAIAVVRRRFRGRAG